MASGFLRETVPRDRIWKQLVSQGLASETGTASLLANSISQSSHRVCPDSRGRDYTLLLSGRIVKEFEAISNLP